MFSCAFFLPLDLISKGQEPFICVSLQQESLAHTVGVQQTSDIKRPHPLQCSESYSGYS